MARMENIKLTLSIDDPAIKEQLEKYCDGWRFFLVRVLIWTACYLSAKEFEIPISFKKPEKKGFQDE